MKIKGKVAVIVGAPTTVENPFKEHRPLAYVYLKKHFFIEHELIVKPVAPEYTAFAEEAKRRIMARIARDPVESFLYPNPTPESPHGNKVAGFNDPDLLEGIAHSLHLWNDGGKGIVADHYVLPNYSYIEERKI